MAALAAVGVASAQSSVTISGAMVLGVGATKTDATSTGTQIIRQTGNLAFGGTEDLGGGLKASFRLETSIGSAAASENAASATAGTAPNFGDRGAYLTLESGAVGSLLVGRAASGIRGNMGAVGDVSRLAVPTGLSTGTSSAVTNDVGARVIIGDAYSNQVAYQSPTISGFNVTVGIAPVQGSTATTKDTVSYGLNYAQGPLAARFNVTDVKATSGGTAATDTAYKLSTLNASYDLGVARVGLTYQATSVSTGVKPGKGTAVTANIPLGSGSVGLGYGKRSASAAESTRAGGDNVSQMFVGYRHDLSKRTNVQVVYNKLNRQGSATTGDVKESYLLVGHSF